MPPAATRAPIAVSPEVPAFWTVFLTWYLDASPELAKQLWRVYVLRCSATLLWRLGLCEERPTDVETYKARVRGFAALVTPKDLLTAAERLSPPGKRRRPDIVCLEECILGKLDAQGRWIL